MFSRLTKPCLRSVATNRAFHTSSSRPAVPPVLYLLVKPLTRVAAAVLGRSARLYWKKLPADSKKLIKEAALVHKKKFLFSGALFGGGLLYAYESHVQECPVTGRKRFVALYPEQMKSISKNEFENMIEEFQDYILPNNHREYERVARVSNRLLNGNKDLRQIYDKNWTITVINQPIQNAMVLPSGNIFIFRGMLDLCKNDDQLAVIIGHEMAHSILGHVAEKLTLASFVQVVLLVPMALLWALMPNGGIAIVCDWFIDKVTNLLVHLPFSRYMELEADEVGLILAAKACFDVREAPAFWELLELLDDDPLSNEEDLEFLATHPVHKTRYEKLSDLLTSALVLRQFCGCEKLNPNSDPKLKIEDFKKVMKSDFRKI